MDPGDDGVLGDREDRPAAVEVPALRPGRWLSHQRTWDEAKCFLSGRLGSHTMTPSFCGSIATRHDQPWIRLEHK